MVISVRKPWSAIGLIIALVGTPIVAAGYRVFIGEPASTLQVALREVAIASLLLGLLLIMFRRERMTLSSIGLRVGIRRSFLWGMLLFVLLGLGTAAVLILLHLLGLSYGKSHSFVAPLWLTAIVVLRAGVVEEIFYRGYAVERIGVITSSRVAAGMLSLTAFALSHYHQGVAGIIVALVLGAILTGFYLWRGDLMANITGHVLIDFVPNVVLPMLGS